jgi:hypothetical protein
VFCQRVNMSFLKKPLVFDDFCCSALRMFSYRRGGKSSGMQTALYSEGLPKFSQ